MALQIEEWDTPGGLSGPVLTHLPRLFCFVQAKSGELGV